MPLSLVGCRIRKLEIFGIRIQPRVEVWDPKEFCAESRLDQLPRSFRPTRDDEGLVFGLKNGRLVWLEISKHRFHEGPVTGDSIPSGAFGAEAAEDGFVGAGGGDFNI